MPTPRGPVATPAVTPAPGLVPAGTGPVPAPGPDAALTWPVVDGAAFLTATDISTTCNVKPRDVAVAAQPPDPPRRDDLGEDRTLYVGHVKGAGRKPDDHFMGIVVQIRESANHAAQLHKAFAYMYEPVAGTNLSTDRQVDKSGWVRREVHGINGRYLFSVYETDDKGERIVCDDDELLALGRLIDSRLPALP